MAQQANTVTLDREDYDNMREDIRVFYAGAVRVNRRHLLRPDGGGGSYYQVNLEVGDVELFVREEVSKELADLREVTKSLSVKKGPIPDPKAAQNRPAERRAELILGIVLGAAATSVIWWATL